MNILLDYGINTTNHLLDFRFDCEKLKSKLFIKSKKNNKRKMTDENTELWLKNMKKCLHRKIIITFKGDLNVHECYPKYAYYKGHLAHITGFYGLGHKIFAFVGSLSKSVKLHQENFYFCDNDGNKISEPGEWPPDI